MKTIVIYDSQYGNTAKIAEAIHRGLSESPADLEEVKLSHIDSVRADELTGFGLIIVGSPTQKFRPTSATTDFLKRIPKDSLKGVKVAAFDTRITEEQIRSHALFAKLVPIFGFAAKPISDRLEKNGGQQVMPPEGFTVEGMEGPLTEGELERAEAWARQILPRL